MNKQELRQMLRSRRLAMSQGEVEQKSRVIAERFFDELGGDVTGTVLLYQSIEKLNEVDTGMIVERLRLERPDVRLELMSHDKEAVLPAGIFEVIVVPVLGFDKDNFRIGWGGGFYDRFLASRRQVLKIGLCFQNGFVPEGLPHESHDVPLDMIITDES